MKFFMPLILCAFGAYITSCSSSSSTTNEVGSAITTAKEKIANAVPDTSSVSTSLLSSSSTITALWTNTSYAIGGIFGDSPRNSIRMHGDDTTENGLMYRFQQNMEGLCVYTQALPTTGSELDLSSGGTLELTAAVKATLTSTCSADLSNMPDGSIVGYKVEDISSNSGTLYDKKVSFDVDGNSTYTEYAAFFYYRISGTLIRMSFVEDSTNDSVAMFEYDSSTGIAKFEFSESAPAPFTVHYRVLLNENTDLAYFTAYVTNNTDTMQAVVSTNEGGGDEMAVSYTFDGTSDITDGNACISTSDLSVVTDNTLTCTGVTGSAASSYSVSHAGIDGTYILGLDETSSIQFTSSTDILTAAVAN